MKHHTGRHRVRAERATVVGVIPLAIAITCAGPAFAQPGVVVPEAEQPGVVAEAAPAPAPAPEPAPEPVVEEPKTYWIAPPAEYAEVPTRPVPTYEYTEPVAPVQFQELHLPVAVEVVAPIEAPKERLRIGDFVSDQPNWLSDEYLDRTNNTSAVIEAQVNTFWKSIGVDAERSDRIAAATVGGAAVGAVTGAVAVGVPFAVGGALVGGTIGGTSGANLVPGSWLYALPLGATTGIVGTAIGAGVGAAVAGIPAAATGAVIGGVAGGLAGAAFGAGDSLGTPTEFVLPNVTEPDAAALKLQAAEEYARLAIQHPAAATAVVDAVVAAPQVADQVTSRAVAAREATLAQPGGEQVIAGLDAAAVELNHAFGPVAGMTGEALAAGRDGLAV